MLTILPDPAMVRLALLIAFALAISRQDEDDDELASALRAGDHTAFRRFFEANHETIYRYLRRRGLSVEVATDAVQQAFVVLWEKRDQIRAGTSLRAYVFQIAYRRALNELRANRLEGIEESFDTAGPQHAIREDVERSSDHVLLLDRFEEVVDGLPERRRLVFELCFVHGYTYREAAAVLEVSVKTVENQMGHALKTLRAAFEAYR